MNDKVLSPVAVFCYNRPWHIEQTLEALSNNELASDSIIYIFCDGAKEDATAEQIKQIEEVRRVVRKKQWGGEVHIVESDKNKGLRDSIIGGASMVIEKYGKVIVLEDDLVTSPFFLKYMNEALDFYENYKSVFSISAQSNVDPDFFPKDYPYDVYACQTHMPWGWATWKDRWNLVDWDIDKKLAGRLENEEYMRNAFMRGGEDLYYRSLMERLGGKKVWSVCFSLAHFKYHAVSITPVISYIRNIGFDGSGENCGDAQTSPLNHNYYVNAKRDVRFLDVVYMDSRIINRFYSGSILHRRPFFKRIKNRLVYLIFKKKDTVLKGNVYYK